MNARALLLLASLFVACAAPSAQHARAPSPALRRASASVVSAETTAPKGPRDEPPPPVDPCARARAVAEGPSLLEDGLRAWYGDGEPQDTSRARTILERACGAMGGNGRLEGDSAACTMLGLMYESGEGLAFDPVLAQGYYELATMGALFDLGGCELGSSSRTRGIDSSMSACDRGAESCPAACQASCDTALSRRRNLFGFFDRACKRERASACFLAGFSVGFGAYEDGVGRVLDGGQDMAPTLQKACALGFGRACEVLAGYREEPDRKDNSREVALLRRGCELRDGPACARLALLYKAGRGVPEDYAKALETFEEACREGMLLICADLSRMYRDGDGVPHEPEHADALAELAKGKAPPAR